MIYQHPLAYLLGLEGIALLRGWEGDFDKDFVDRRLAEVRRLLATEAIAGHDGVMVNRSDTLTGYRRWAATYDEPRNSLFDCDEPVMHEIIDALPPGDALDAACSRFRTDSEISRLHDAAGSYAPVGPVLFDALAPDAFHRFGDLEVPALSARMVPWLMTWTLAKPPQLAL